MATWEFRQAAPMAPISANMDSQRTTDTASNTH